MALWSRIQSFFRRGGRADPLVRVSDDGFDLLDGATQAVIRSVRWADVAKIQTYKLDLFTTDCICLLFESRSGRPPVQVSEEWKGFSDLFDPLTAAFPSIPQNWYMEVMTPAFKTKQAVLYDATRLHSKVAV
jgi:hypothetical protein